jgi:hypothetical protein
MLIENERGDQLLELIRCDEEELTRLVPLTHALVVAKHAGKHLLVFNRHRGHWELAGGTIEHGALYVVDIERIDPFVANEEISEICWWDGGELTGELDAIDRRLTQLV